MRKGGLKVSECSGVSEKPETELLMRVVELVLTGQEPLRSNKSHIFCDWMQSGDCSFCFMKISFVNFAISLHDKG